MKTTPMTAASFYGVWLHENGQALFPSHPHAGGTNLAVFCANLGAGDSAEVHDPDGRLPKDQSSWE